MTHNANRVSDWCLRCDTEFFTRRKETRRICTDCEDGDDLDWATAESIAGKAAVGAIRRLYGAHGRYALMLVCFASSHGYAVEPNQKLDMQMLGGTFDHHNPHSVLLRRQDGTGHLLLTQTYDRPLEGGAGAGRAPYWPSVTSATLFHVVPDDHRFRRKFDRWRLARRRASAEIQAKNIESTAASKLTKALAQVEANRAAHDAAQASLIAIQAHNARFPNPVTEKGSYR